MKGKKEMRCKNKEVIVKGLEYDGKTTLKQKMLRCICTNDEKGKTLSIDNGDIQLTIPFEAVEKFFEGSYRPKWKT